MGRWLSLLIATTCVVVISVGGLLLYDRYQAYVDAVKATELKTEQLALERCNNIIIQAAVAKPDDVQALECSDKYPSLSWYRQSQNDEMERQKSLARQTAKAEDERRQITQIRAGYQAREAAAKDAESKNCFASVRTMYTAGGKDALYTLRPNDKMLTIVQKCVSDGYFTLDEVRLVAE